MLRWPPHWSPDSTFPYIQCTHSTFPYQTLLPFVNDWLTLDSLARSRLQAPQVSLKERIAALQQRDVRATSPGGPSALGPSSSPGPSSVNALRDKIAKFEREGAVPVPRGSFGMGAPPLAENGQLKRRGELYGNRIPAPVSSRLPSNPPPISRSSSPLLSPTRRNVSMPTSDVAFSLDDAASKDKIRSFPASPPQPIDTSSHPRPGQHKPRSPSFATALEIARNAAQPPSVAVSPSPTPSPSPSRIPLARRRYSSFTGDESPLLFLQDSSSEQDSTLINDVVRTPCRCSTNMLSVFAGNTHHWR